MEEIIVIHETVIPVDDVLIQMQTNGSGLSYHCLIRTDGSIVYAVPYEYKAYAAYRSSFNGFDINGSVDDFAYHIALETQIDDANLDADYTIRQYMSLAYLISLTGIDDDHIVTHEQVDTTGTFNDPRNFDVSQLFKCLRKFNRTKRISWL